MEKAYALIQSGDTFKIQEISVLSNESMGVYRKGLKMEELVLAGLTKSTYKGKPFWYSKDKLSVDPGAKPQDLEKAVQAVAERRLWKFMGQRNLTFYEILVIMGAGYGILSWLLTIVNTIFQTKK